LVNERKRWNVQESMLNRDQTATNGPPERKGIGKDGNTNHKNRLMT